MPKKPFLLRIDDQVLAALQRWADEDLRSLNSQIDYLLRQSLQKRGVKVGGLRRDEASPKESSGPETSTGTSASDV